MVSKSGVKEESGTAGRPCGGDAASANGIYSFCLALITNEIQAELIWEISSLLCSRNCALREAYTILYIASRDTFRDRKLKSNYKLKNIKMIMEKKEMYLAPEVEILEVEVEKGFAGSLMPDLPGDDWA